MPGEHLYTFEQLMQAVAESGKLYDTARIAAAYQMALQAHSNQKRASGEMYISHPVSVACILVEMGMDSETVIAALLHDVVEDTDMSLEQIEKQFGAETALIVGGVTKLGRIPYHSREEEQAENIRKMLLAMAQDVRVIIVKLADRLHNARTFCYLEDDKRRYKALETMEIYAPIADRLGMRALKEELEDISLHYLDPVACAEIERQLSLRQEERQRFLESIKKRIYERIRGEHPDAVVEGRVKSMYGIYRKIFIQGRVFDEVFDVYAIRIIVNSVIDCYNILGIIHDMFRPIPNRFKDYISTPKKNMYQSLHTTVFDKEGIPFETQIRTWDMHHTAEYGIAAHWKYKAGISGKDKLEERLAWVRQLIESQQEGEDAEEIVRSIKSDIAPEEVFVFTPKGDVINLPAGSTVIDFAYAIHSQVGNRMVGAKVDGRMVSIDFVVQTGMIVEILTSNAKTQGPSRDWLNIVRTNEARSKIRSWFKKERFDENLAAGREAVEKEFKRNYINLNEEQYEQFIQDEAKRQHFGSVNEFFAAVGYGGLSLTKIMPRIKEEYAKLYRTPDPAKVERMLSKPKRERKSPSGVIVEGLEGCLVKFARCCNPLPGDEIVGFVTRGYGVSIHKKDCSNVLHAVNDKEQQARWVKAHWASVVKETYQSTVIIMAASRGGLLADISILLNNMHVPIYSFIAKELSDNKTQIQITMGITDVNQLNFIVSNLKKITGILSIERMNQ